MSGKDMKKEVWVPKWHQKWAPFLDQSVGGKIGLYAADKWGEPILTCNLCLENVHYCPICLFPSV